MKIISFSLWGNSPKYVTGALRNAALAASVYPGWRCRFHCGGSVPGDAIAALTAHPHVDVVRHNSLGDWTAMFWRFLELADPAVEAAIIRDADSRLNARERAAVDAWLASGIPSHVMRDHPAHDRVMLGGMWGARGGLFTDIGELIARHSLDDRYQVDQDFLEVVIWPRMHDRCMQHDEYYGGLSFPTRRRGTAFVGQPFDEFDRPLIEGPTHLARQLKQRTRRLAELAGLCKAPMRFTS